jgi:hypothetical protein
MSPEDQTALAQDSQEIAKILHRNPNPDEIKTLEGIESTVRQQMLEHVSPEIGWGQSAPAQLGERSAKLLARGQECSPRESVQWSRLSRK